MILGLGLRCAPYCPTFSEARCVHTVPCCCAVSSPGEQGRRVLWVGRSNGGFLTTNKGGISGGGVDRPC
eukprot:scaffold108452_cov34-Tisochrysis_lutea.AAC.3